MGSRGRHSPRATTLPARAALSWPLYAHRFMAVISRIHQLRYLRTSNAAKVSDGDPCTDVVLPPKRDSYAVVERSLEAWGELGNDRDRRESSKALKQRLSQLASETGSHNFVHVTVTSR